MREDCKYFQTRSFPSGDVRRFCALDLAPEAPWRCPEHCPRYSPLVGDPSLRRGPAERPAEKEPEPELHPDAVAVLGSAEEIISAVAPHLAAEETRRRREEEAKRNEPSWWDRFRSRSRWRR
jgi:hypothetical protein